MLSVYFLLRHAPLLRISPLSCLTLTSPAHRYWHYAPAFIVLILKKEFIVTSPRKNIIFIDYYINVSLITSRQHLVGR